jgi:hypothetical protein
MEQTHLIFFENDIVGAEYNFHGPRVARLCDYLAQKCSSLPRIRLDPLLKKSVREQLDRLEDVRAIRLRLFESEFHLLSAAQESLAEALESTGRQYGAGQMELVLKPGKSGRRGRLKMSASLALLKELAGSKGLDERDVVAVRGRDERNNKVDWFDLLKNKFVFTDNVVKQDARHRAVDGAAMFSAIASAYNDNREVLENAPAIGDDL